MVAFTLGAWIPAAAQAQQQINQGQLKPQVIAPTGGIQTNTADILRTKEYAKVINNLQMLKRGVWTSRGIGWTKQRAGQFNSGAAFLEMAQHFTTSGTQRFVFQVGDKVYSYDLGTSTETQLASSLSTSAIPCMRSYSSTVFIYVNGDSEPRFWDGNPANTLATGGVFPVTVATVQYSKPTIVELFATRAVYAGFAAQPYTVLLSDAYGPNQFTASVPLSSADCGAFTLPAALGPIIGLRTLRLGNSTNDQILLIGCTRGIAFIGGTDATNFYQREITRSHGLLSNRAWVQVQNDLYYPATDGLRSLSNLNTAATLAPETVSHGINDLWNRINTTHKGKIFAVHHPSTQEVQLWLPIDAETTCKNVLVLNYNTQRNVDGTIAPIFSTKSGIEGSCGTDYNGTTYIGGVGSTVGYLQTHYSGDDYDGTYIAWIFMPALMETNAANPMQSSGSRRFVIITEGATQAFTAEAYVVNTLSTGASQWRQVFSQRLGATAATITDLGTWKSGTTTTYPHLIEFDPMGNARFWGIRLYAAQAGDHIDVVAISQTQAVGGTRQ